MVPIHWREWLHVCRNCSAGWPQCRWHQWVPFSISCLLLRKKFTVSFTFSLSDMMWLLPIRERMEYLQCMPTHYRIGLSTSYLALSLHCTLSGSPNSSSNTMVTNTNSSIQNHGQAIVGGTFKYIVLFTLTCLYSFVYKIVITQSPLPDVKNAVLFAFILYADKTQLSSHGTVKGYRVVARCANLPTDIRNREWYGDGCVIGWLPIISSCLIGCALMQMLTHPYHEGLWTG